ncbi:MAG: erythronate-4-phosphate dehydrogenase, partial [Paludibacteraceae bacterium]|nr:erythronate-4-phosphate dehydrogenase [Paludibacteraceae bacterium]
EGEPHINRDVLQHALLASMHIAGYTVQGKRNASQTCLDALCTHFHLPSCTLADEQLPQGDTEHGWLERISRELKNSPDAFEQLRKKYKLR